MTPVRDAAMHGRTNVESFRKLLLLARDQIGLTPVLYRDYAREPDKTNVLLVRHDVDHSLDNAMMLAEIESSMGLVSTYFMLHPGDYDHMENYYGTIENGRIIHHPTFFERCRKLQDMGHEVAIHNDFFQLAFLTGRSAADLIADELAAFAKAGVPVSGTASHGSTFVRKIEATNYEIFAECVSGGRATRRAVQYGSWEGQTHAISMKQLGLSYEAYFLPRNIDISDTGSALSVTSKAARHMDFSITAPEHYKMIHDAAKAIDDIRMVMLIHPCWWSPVEAPPDAGGMPLRGIAPAVPVPPAEPAAASAQPADAQEISLETVRAKSSEAAFPCAILAECQSGVAFFCAAFHGYNDVIHLYTHHVTQLWLNDIDAEKLARMGQLYGASERLLPGDSFALARQLAAKGQRFDIVVCDPFTNLMKRTMIDEFDAFSGLATKWFVSGWTGALFAEQGIEPTAAALTQWFHQNGHPEAVVDHLVMRNSDFKNGVYWAVFRLPGATWTAPVPAVAVAQDI